MSSEEPTNAVNWKYEKPNWWSESCARRDYERLRSEVERLRPVVDILKQENERLRDEVKDLKSVIRSYRTGFADEQ